ncbi:MAG TPA: UDP-N-acetylglucosamine 2-epimerase (non-hydrolyzing) [Candidatus Bathyarchaeia archaeon]|nr:UDP-N-acetylglucosamine 2-epimerase (non-hydrolyzing) [Candidatus Bathyarchaeia archaeon]
MRLMLVIGARPQIIKSAPIIREAQNHKEIELQLIHTGQHYDFEMSKIFFNEMELPAPLANLGVGSGTHAWQTGTMMIRLEETIAAHKPDMVMVPGDTNSTIAGALTAVKLHLPVAHVEAGARSFDTRMPEEINRRLTDHCSSLLFAPTRNCASNLTTEGLPKKNIKVSGDTMYDALLQHMPIASKNNILKRLGLRSEKYAALTLHRPENVDDRATLERIVKAMMILSKLTVVFPVHPRTRQRLANADLLKRIEATGHMKLIDPVGYNEMLQLTEHAKMVFTDSGGLQKEAFWLHTPCITLRNTTEWTETVGIHSNILAGSNPARIIKAAREIMKSPDVKNKFRKLKNPFGDGQASQRIVAEVLRRK